MTIIIETNGYVLPVSSVFVQHLVKVVNQQQPQLPTTVTKLTLSFTDPNYSKKVGGFHPTEVVLKQVYKGDDQNNSPCKKESTKRAKEPWRITFIRDFCNVSHHHYPKFAPDIELDFEQGIFHNINKVYTTGEASELYEMWQTNFIYFWQQCGAYQVEVSAQ